MIRHLYIHPLTWLLAGTALLTGFFKDLILLFVIILIHEWGHYSMARYFKWRIRRIVLLPFGGVAEVDEHGNRPFKEDFLIIFFGPFQHVWMLALGYVLYSADLWSAPFFEKFLAFNLMILLFNLLPIWPLDGGKFLFLLFAYFRPFKKAHLTILTFSLLFLFSLLLFSTIMATFHLNLVVISLFLFFSIFTEWRHHYYVFIRFLLERLEKEGPSVNRQKTIAVSPSDQIEVVLSAYQKDVHHTVALKNWPANGEKDEHVFLDAFFNQKKVGATVQQLFRVE